MSKKKKDRKDKLQELMQFISTVKELERTHNLCMDMTFTISVKPFDISAKDWEEAIAKFPNAVCESFAELNRKQSSTPEKPSQEPGENPSPQIGDHE